MSCRERKVCAIGRRAWWRVSALLLATGLAILVGLCPRAALADEDDPKLEICDALCASPEAFCIEFDNGRPFCEGGTIVHSRYEKPASLQPGATLVVRVIGHKSKAQHAELKVDLIRSTDTIFPDTNNAPPAAQQHSYAVLREQEGKVPDDASVTALKITFRRADNSTIKSSYEIRINHGNHYVQIGVLFPITIDGSRAVTPALLPGSGGVRRLTVNEDWSVNPALVLNLFPGGRRKGVVSSFSHCCEAYNFWDSAGIQAGVDLDLGDPFDRIFVGLVFEPVSGLSLNAGAAFVKGEFVPEGYAAGMVVPQDETFTPDRRYMTRFYFGATLTLDIVETVARAAGRANGI